MSLGETHVCALGSHPHVPVLVVTHFVFSKKCKCAIKQVHAHTHTLSPSVTRSQIQRDAHMYALIGLDMMQTFL